MHPRHAQQFGYHFFVLVRALAQIDGGQVKAKYFDSPDQRVQTLRAQGSGVVAQQRGFDGAQILHKLLGLGVGVLRGDGVECGFGAGQLLQGRGQARIDAYQRAAVGLVTAVRVVVRAAFGQGLHIRAALGQEGRERQLTAQVMHLGEVMAQRHFALATQRVVQGLGADIGVAIAVAANPLAHAQKRVRHTLAQHVFHVGIQLGNFTQKRAFVIAQRVFDFIGHAELAAAQQPGLPELHHAGAHLGFVGSQFAQGQGIGVAAGVGAQALDVLARGQQLGDGALGIQNTFALHLGRVGGEHRRDKALRQALRHGLGADTAFAQACQCHFQAAFLQLARPVMDRVAADLVPVFGQIGQVAEVGEGADDADRLRGVQAFEQFFQGLVGGVVGIAPKGHRQAAHLLHQFKGLHAIVLPDDVTQNAPEQADVFQ